MTEIVVIGGGGTSTFFCSYKPSLFFQEVKTWQAIDKALEIKMDLATGLNFAKFPTAGGELTPERIELAKVQALKVVLEGKSAAEANMLSQKLFDASTWGDTSSIEHILRTCYVTEDMALSALAEAARRGFANCVEIYLAAGVSPTKVARDVHNAGGRNALHEACAHGQEACAELLIAATTDEAQVLLKTESGATAFDILRANEMNGIVRRLEAFSALKFG